MAKTSIAWCTHSLNFVKWYCTRISPGCKNCYMLELAKRYPQNASEGFVWRKNAMPEMMGFPAGAEVFVGDMYDLFHEEMPLRYMHWHFNAMAVRPDITFLLLTKRIERAYYLSRYFNWTPNIWLGTSVENADYTWRIDWLKRIPAMHKYLSIEPLLGPLGKISLKGIDGVITGAESGLFRRPFDPQWAENIRHQASYYGSAFFHKQGSDQYPGKNRLLFGQTYDDLAWRKR